MGKWWVQRQFNGTPPLEPETSTSLQTASARYTADTSIYHLPWSRQLMQLANACYRPAAIPPLEPTLQRWHEAGSARGIGCRLTCFLFCRPSSSVNLHFPYRFLPPLLLFPSSSSLSIHLLRSLYLPPFLHPSPRPLELSVLVRPFVSLSPLRRVVPRSCLPDQRSQGFLLLAPHRYGLRLPTIFATRHRIYPTTKVLSILCRAQHILPLVMN